MDDEKNESRSHKSLNNMDLKELVEIVAKGEDSQNQFKEDIRNVDSLATEMVAFSNSRGGRIFIGVSNQKTLIGLSGGDVNRVNQLITNAANQHVRSPITVLTENISVGNDTIVIVLTIPEGIDKPYFDHQGVIWLKSGSDKKRVNSKEQLRRIFQEVDLIQADSIPTDVGIEALDIKLFSDFFKDEYKQKIPKSKVDKLRLLENLNLVSNGRLNLAGLLLFGKEPQFQKPAFIIKGISYAGTKIANQYLDSEDFEGPIPEIFRKALSFIMRNLRKVQNNKSVNSIGDPEVPPVVFEELLVNAIIHRDYFISAPIRLFIFEDRIEIISPGHLPDHLTVEKILAGTSIQRNRVITSFIAKGLLPYRGFGTGIRRALEAWPKIRFIDDPDGCHFISIIERVQVHDAPINAPINAPIKLPLSDLQVSIINIIRQNPLITYEEIIIKLGKDRSTIRRNIHHLKLFNLLRRAGSRKKGHWEIIGTDL